METQNVNVKTLEPKETRSATTENVSDVPKQDNIVTRVAGFKPVEQSSPKPSEDIQFNPQDFDKIGTVEDAKKYAETAYKSFERGFQKKFQDLAELKKTLETKVVERENWTTDRVQSLLQDPAFLSVAQGMLNTSKPTEEEYSALSETEKQKIAAIERQNQYLIQQQSLLLQRQQDENLKQKYPNYKQDVVDTITADLLQQKVKNTREYIWRAHDYEDAVKRAYQLGIQDARKNLNENIEAVSYSVSETVSSAPIKREKGESNENLLRRLYMNAIGAKNLS